MINRWHVWKRIALSWIHTFAASVVMIVLIGVLTAISVRFGGVKVVYRILVAVVVFSTFTFLLSEVIVNIILGARKPHSEKHRDFIQGTRELCRGRGLIFQPRPRLYILDMKGPNACAYGWGFLGQYAIGITQGLYDLLSPEELKAVLAHELAHIRCKDVGLLTVIGILSRGGQWLSIWMLRGGFGPFGYLFGVVVFVLARFIFPLGQSAIAQQREYTADALAVLYLGDHRSLKSALLKLRGGVEVTGRESIFSDLFISHPRVKDRVRELERASKQSLLLPRS